MNCAEKLCYGAVVNLKKGKRKLVPSLNKHVGPGAELSDLVLLSIELLDCGPFLAPHYLRKIRHNFALTDIIAQSPYRQVGVFS